jgi:hypothetical protein
MVEGQTAPARRQSRTRNVRLGDLESAIAAAAARAGMTVSAWMRQALRAALPSSAAPSAGRTLPAADPGAKRRLVLRTTAANVLRWQREADDHGLSLARYVELQMSVTPERGRRVAAAAETVRAALIEVAAVGRNLNQLARSWNTYPGQSTASERRSLAGSCAEVDQFCARLSVLVGELEVQQGRRRARKVAP